MTVSTPLTLRWERAQQIDRSAIEALGLGWYVVPSSRDPTGYAVQLEFDSAGRLSAASCTCPDFGKPTTGEPPMLHGIRVCKHILAACLKTKEAGQPDAARETCAPPVNLLIPEPAVAPCPAAGEPAWDEECQEWVLTTSDGIHYCGATPGQCIQQFDEALHYQADHARKNDRPVEELTECPAPCSCAPDDAQVQEPAQIAEFPPRAEAATDHNRRQALSRARGIANQARPLGTAYRLYGIAQGYVLDCPERLMFFAVTSAIPQGMCAKGVSQEEPSGTVRDVRMGAAIVRLRLQEGGLIKVRDLRR